MRIHRILPMSRVNGPGRRFVLWVQGCSRHCEGCFNPSSHSSDGGGNLSVEDILRRVETEQVEGITVSGGEPFEQPEELALLLRKAKEITLTRLVYTGFTYDELLGSNNSAIRECLKLVDILIDGPYKKDIPSKTPWAGSGNQRILELHEGRIIAIANKKYGQNGHFADGEIVIDNAGRMITTGIFDSAGLQEVLQEP